MIMAARQWWRVLSRVATACGLVQGGCRLGRAHGDSMAGGDSPRGTFFDERSEPLTVRLQVSFFHLDRARVLGQHLEPVDVGAFREDRLVVIDPEA